MARGGIMDQKAGEFLSASLDSRWESFFERVEECHRKIRAEEVRRLRVALRRLLSHVEILLQIFRSKAGQRARRQLKKHLKALGPLRDLQMQVSYLAELKRKFPETQDVLCWLGKREKKKLRRARHELSLMALPNLKKELQRATSKTSAHLLKSKGSGTAKQQKALRESFERVEARFNALDRQDVETIHRLRVGFKHYRYLTEVLQPKNRERLEKMKCYQRRMGDIQDLDVVIRALRQYICRKRRKAARALGPLRREIRRRRNAAVRGFWRGRRELFAFALEQESLPKRARRRKKP